MSYIPLTVSINRLSTDIPFFTLYISCLVCLSFLVPILNIRQDQKEVKVSKTHQLTLHASLTVSRPLNKPPSFYGTPKFNYSICCSRPMNTVQKQSKPIRILRTYIFSFNIIIPAKTKPFKVCLSFIGS